MFLETKHDGASKTWPEGQCKFSPFTQSRSHDVNIYFLNSGSTIHLHSPLQISDQETEHINHIPKLMDRTVGFFVLALLLTFYPSSSETYDTLSEGSSLSVEKSNDVLISANGIFSAGFYQVGNNSYNTFCFAIWFTKSWGATTVWMANRDQPVNGRGSKLSLLRNGNLLLTDAGKIMVWMTNTVSTSYVRLQLLNTGNLVLYAWEKTVIWQSFDSPTDTLLPHQILTKDTSLISSRSQSNYSSGFYKLFFDIDNVIRLLFNGPVVSSLYWPDPSRVTWEAARSTYNNSRIARRLTLDFDGNLRIYDPLEEFTINCSGNTRYIQLDTTLKFLKFLLWFAYGLGVLETAIVLLVWLFLFRATRGFTQEIGRGGGGMVYKGVLLDQGKHRLLVYEYMEHGSLAQKLSSNTLDWEKRFQIALGTARGLAYLHEECLEGTRGYMAPEWVFNLPITSKVDVYGYGIVVLEMDWSLDREVAGGESWVARMKEVYRSLEDWRSTFRLGHVDFECNHALKIQPNYTKALLHRAVSNGKLGRWADVVKDYEVLRRELPGDVEVVESLSQAQAALSKSWEDETHSVKFGGEVEESPTVAKTESIKSVPTFKIYKNGDKVNEMICSDLQNLF
ncbi:unnamed protein product, partial [Vitis vinifera]